MCMSTPNLASALVGVLRSQETARWVQRAPPLLDLVLLCLGNWHTPEAERVRVVPQEVSLRGERLLQIPCASELTV